MIVTADIDSVLSNTTLFQLCLESRQNDTRLENNDHKTNQKQTILYLYMLDGKQITAMEILMDTYFFDYTIPHVLRKPPFFYSLSFDKHYTHSDLKFRLK